MLVIVVAELEFGTNTYPARHVSSGLRCSLGLADGEIWDVWEVAQDRRYGSSVCSENIDLFPLGS